MAHTVISASSELPVDIDAAGTAPPPGDTASASRSRSNSERNSRNSNRRFTSTWSGFTAVASRSTSIGASWRSSISSKFLRARSSCSMSDAFSLGVWASTLAKMPSRPPYVVMSLAAVFSPTPGTPGRLSLGSPRSAAYCGYSDGRTPVFSWMPASSYSA